MFEKILNKSGNVKVELLLEKNKKQLNDLNTRIDEMEKAILNGEHKWFLTKCPEPEIPVCQLPKGTDEPCLT